MAGSSGRNLKRLDESEAFDVIAENLESRVSITVGMNDVITRCCGNVPELSELDYGLDCRSIGEWLKTVLNNEPPPTKANLFWFGLRNSNEVSISGYSAYTNRDFARTWITDENRIYNPLLDTRESAILDAIHAFASQNEDYASFIEYTLCLAYGALAVNSALQSIPSELILSGAKERFVNVGWDSGDWLELGKVTNAGLCYMGQTV